MCYILRNGRILEQVYEGRLDFEMLAFSQIFMIISGGCDR
jgi:hypothetical protein